MSEPGQKDYQTAFDLNVGDTNVVKCVARAIAAAREEGLSEGMTVEAINCHEHSQAAAKAERARIIAELREWAQEQMLPGGMCATDIDILLAHVDQMGRLVDREGSRWDTGVATKGALDGREG